MIPTLSDANHVSYYRQDFKNNENQLFKNIDALQKGAAGAGKKKSGGMKEAADAAEQIRKWVSKINNKARVWYTLQRYARFLYKFRR